MFREEMLSSSSLWPDSVHVGAELNPKVKKNFTPKFRNGGGGIYYPARCNNLAQHNLSNESCESLSTSKYQKKLRLERQQEENPSKLRIILYEKG